ncbi:MAG TPA: hypothetical protein VL728_08585 [Cyclobacteriaceae bacterium]|jgi:hypothetical protein|nr:hypothetical protein [Cyclobacteriaceae bacterium]
MVRSSKVGFPLLLIIGFSCSIIKDSDITSLSQLNQLRLSGIDVTQNLATTIVPTATIAVTDSIYKTPITTTIDLNNKINGTIVRQSIFTWPVFTKTKMIFRSKISSTGIVIRTSFYDNGNPRGTTVSQNNQLKEWYSYLYNSQWRVTNVISRVFATDTTVYNDSLIYNTQGYVSTLLRRSKGAPLVTLNFQYQTYSSNSLPQLGGSSSAVQYNGYNYNYGNCNCPSSSGNSCSGADLNTNSGQLNARYIITGAQTNSILTQLEIDDIKTGGGNCGNSGNTGAYDTYYFHPLMINRGYFTHGDILLNIYSIDWWLPGAVTTGGPTTNEGITFKFNYAR